MNKKELAYYIAVFGSVFVYLLLEFPSFHPFPEFATGSVTLILTLFGYQVVHMGSMLLIDGFNPVQISAECSGIVILLVFIFTIHVLPVISFKHKVSSLLLLPLLLIGNVLRLLLSIITGVLISPQAMIFVHDTIGQIFIFLWAILLYIVWLRVLRLLPKESFNAKLFNIMRKQPKE